MRLYGRCSGSTQAVTAPNTGMSCTPPSSSGCASRDAALLPALRRIVATADPEQPISEVRALADIVSDETAPRVTQLRLLGALSAIALLIAGLGIHGLLAFLVSRRTRELGVRRAGGGQQEPRRPRVARRRSAVAGGIAARGGGSMGRGARDGRAARRRRAGGPGDATWRRGALPGDGRDRRPSSGDSRRAGGPAGRVARGVALGRRHHRTPHPP